MVLEIRVHALHIATYIYVIHVRCPYVHVQLQLLLPQQANGLAVLLLLL